MLTPSLAPTTASGPCERRWLLGQAVLLAVIGAALLCVFETSDLDRQLAHLIFDADKGVFPLRRDELFEFVLHKGAKQVSFLAVVAALIVCWQGWRGRLAWLAPRNAGLAASGMVFIPVSIALLKLVTHRHCPWDLTDFGGYAPYLRLLEPAPQDLKAGQCFPAGHASTGFLWIVWGVALRPAGRVAARLGLVAGLSAGGVLGLARMAQGAHFLSHTLATLWCAWTLTLLLAAALKADLQLGKAGRSDSGR